MIAPLTDRALLEAWAVNRRESTPERADDLLALSLPPPERERLGEWPLAHRNAALAELRRSRWGSTLEAVVACPSCGEELELSFDLDAVQKQASEVEADEAPATVVVRTEAGSWELRLPTAADVAAAAEAGDPDRGRRELVARCMLRTPRPEPDLDAAQVEALGEALGEADPFGAASLAVECPQCAGRWEEPLDVGDFLAREAELEAREIVSEVHMLASAYGWTEAEILELPRARRQVYMELID